MAADPAVSAPRGRPRIILGIAPNAGDRLSVLTVQPEDFVPLPPNSDRLSGWVADGWRLSMTPRGNLGRDAHIQMQKGAPVAFAQALLGVERDGKHSKVVQRDVLTTGVDEPDDWKTIQGWLIDGWSLSDITGNLEHGSWVVMQKPIDDATGDDK